ncbi:MAG: phosphoribosylamine--glycine ligase [Candidatus Daviesbacteria bacterium]
MAKQETIVLVVGGGGRESALVEKYLQSPWVDGGLAIPGNDWIKSGTSKPVETFSELKTTSIPEIKEICRERKPALADIAQDDAVAAGLADKIRNLGIPTIGPSKAAGQIEWDKAWAREFGAEWHLPQPDFRICHTPQEGFEFLESQPDQAWFVKASHLAAGKGALPAITSEEARQRILEMERFGEAGKVFLIEKWLKNDNETSGEEFSAFALFSGRKYKIVGFAQDYKRALDLDLGENTGSMGCSSPPLFLDCEMEEKIKSRIFNRALIGLEAERRPYQGVLYLGGMVIKEENEWNPYVVEFNARWGDPEAQAILPGMKNDLFEVSMAVAKGNIKRLKLEMDGKSRIVVTGASKGYPGNYEAALNKQIYGLDEALKMEGIKIYGAGIKIDKDGNYWTAGGRLFYIVGEGDNIIKAHKKTYQAMDLISVEDNNLHFRTDIGWRDYAKFIQRRGF